MHDPCGNYAAHGAGRFASLLPAEAVARIFGTVNPLPNLAPSWKSRRPTTAPWSAAILGPASVTSIC
jgi:hypothetical protein